MNVHIGGEWYLGSDPLNYILRQEYESKQKNSLGKLVVTEKGYFKMIEHILNAVLDKGLKQSEAETVLDFKNDIEEIRKMIHEYCVDKELGFKELCEENERLRQEIKRLTSKEEIR